MDNKEEHHDEDDEVKRTGCWSKVLGHLEDSIEELAPGGIDAADMKKLGIMIPVTALYIFVFVGSLLYFSYQGAIQMQNQHFLSAEAQDGSVCNTVPSYISATYEADLNGKWSTASSQFQTNSSFFSLEFTGVAVDQNSYMTSMYDFQSKLNVLGKKALERDITYTMLVLATMLWRFSATGIKFSSNVQPDIAFGSMQPWSWAIVNHKGRCVPLNQTGINGTTVGSSYDKLRSSFVVSIDGISIDSSKNYIEPCPDQIPSLYNLLGYRSDKVGSSFNARFDIRTVSDVVAINLGMFNKEDFNMLNIGTDVSALGLPDGSFYIDSYYKYFQPFFCLSDKAKGNKGPDVCFLALNGIKASSPILGDILSYTLFYPTLTSYGDFTTTSTAAGPCQCPRDKNSPSCNTPDHLLSLFFDTG